MPVVIASYLHSNYSTNLSLNNSYLYRGQSFYVGGNYVIDTADFYLRKVGSPTGNVVAQIYAHTGTFGSTGKPTGSPIAVSDPVNVSGINTGLTTVTFHFSGNNRILLVPSERYFIVLHYPDGTSSNYITIDGDSTSPTHPGNTAYSLDVNGSSWTSVSAVDLCFTISPDPNPLLFTDSVLNIKKSSADLVGNIHALGVANALSKGFQWGTAPGIYANSSKEEINLNVGAFTHSVDDLPDDTIIFFRAYLELTNGKYYGGEVSFKTQKAKKKKFVFKVYDKSGKFITTWNDVISEVAFNQEINSAGGQIELLLARNSRDFGEGVDVDYGLNVQIFVYDEDSPSGSLLLQGYISAYEVDYNSQNIKVTLLTYGAELDTFMVQDALAPDANGDTNFSSSVHGVLDYIRSPFGGYAEDHNAVMYNDCFTVASGCTSLGRIDIKYAGGNFDDEREYVVLRSGLPVCDTIKVNGSASGSEELGPDLYDKIIFPEPIAVTPGEKLSIIIRIPTAVDWEYYFFGKTAYVAPPPTRGFSADGTTLVPFLSKDPSEILKGIIDRYRAVGGKLNYSDDSIEDTGTTVSYTFNSNTTLEGIKKVIELAPSGWYWYVDYATNLIHFHPKDSASKHTLKLKKDISGLTIRKSIENLINTIYFTGGDVGGGTLLYKKFQDTNSISKYGIRSMKYIDQRVTDPGTAQTIADAIFGTRSTPEFRIDQAIGDSNGVSLIGYDIESILIGDVVEIENIEDDSLVEMQIQKLSYTPDILKMYVSTVAPDINKRIEDINRNLEATQTLLNPSSPS